MYSVLIELKAKHISTTDLHLIEEKLKSKASSFKIDMNYPLVPMQDQNQELNSYLIKGEIDQAQLNQLKTSNEVIDIFSDTTIAPFE